MTLKIAKVSNKMFAAQLCAETAADDVLFANSRTVLDPGELTDAIKALSQNQWQEMANNPPARELFGQAMVMCAADKARDLYLTTASLLGIFKSILHKLAHTKKSELAPRMMWRRPSDAAAWQRFVVISVTDSEASFFPKFHMIYNLKSILMAVQMELVESEKTLQSLFLDKMIASTEEILRSGSAQGTLKHFDNVLERTLWHNFLISIKQVPTPFNRRSWLNCLMALLKAFKEDFPFLKLPPQGPKYYIWHGRRYKRAKGS